MNPSATLHPEDYRTRCGALSVRQACLPAGVDPIEQHELDTLVSRRRPLEIGARLFHVGTAMSSVYVARSGTFKACVTTPEGAERIVAFFLPGELVGLDGLGAGLHRCEAIALEPAEVCEIDFDRLLEVSGRLPRLRAQLHKVVGQAIGRDHDHAAMLTLRLAHERVASFLDDLAQRYCLLGMQASAFRLPMSREDIARFLGLTLESVSRSLGRLQDDGVLRVKGRQIEILDPPALAELSRAAA